MTRLEGLVGAETRPAFKPKASNMVKPLRTIETRDGSSVVLNDPVPVRRPWRRVSTIAVVLIALMIVNSAATNANFRWDVVGLYLFDPQILRGVTWTLLLTVLAMMVAIAMAMTLVFMRESGNPLLQGLSWLWVWFFRGTPVYTQLVFWGLISVLYPRLGIALPFGQDILSVRTADVLTPGVAAILGLGLNESAYLAEIFRAGFRSVEKGQREAAESIGMRRMALLRRIILPQAMRVIIPPTGNETIGMLKTTSLVLAVPFAYDLTFVANTVSNRLYLPIPLLVVAAFWYLAITSVLMIGQHFLERHFGRGIDVLAIKEW